MKSRQIQLKKRPEGMPSKEDFQLAEVEIREISDGEFAVKNEWLSVDPYMRGRMKDTESYVPPFALGEAMEGGCVGMVTESKNDDFPEGTWVLGNSGWRDNWISDGEGIVSIDTDKAPASAYLSVLGLTGMTAYIGLTEIASLKDGDTVFVSAASGAVGSIAAQIAKLHGCGSWVALEVRRRSPGSKKKRESTPPSTITRSMTSPRSLRNFARMELMSILTTSAVTIFRVPSTT